MEHEPHTREPIERLAGSRQKKPPQRIMISGLDRLFGKLATILHVVVERVFDSRSSL